MTKQQRWVGICEGCDSRIEITVEIDDDRALEWSAACPYCANGNDVTFVSAGAASPSQEDGSGPAIWVCSHDPNTCQVTVCGWPECGKAARPLHSETGAESAWRRTFEHLPHKFTRLRHAGQWTSDVCADCGQIEGHKYHGEQASNSPVQPASPEAQAPDLRAAFKAGFLAVIKEGSMWPRGPKAWDFDGIAADDLEQEAWEAWAALASSPVGQTNSAPVGAVSPDLRAVIDAMREYSSEGTLGTHSVRQRIANWADRIEALASPVGASSQEQKT